MKNFQELPLLRDSISYVYIEHARIEQEDSSIVIIKKDGKIPIPVATVTCLLLGPGTAITHAAIRVISENGCLIVWCGENVQKFYAYGIGETHSSKNILLQAELCTNQEQHLEVVKRMYKCRFSDLPKAEYTLQQLRGIEGVRVKQTYKAASKIFGIPWRGRTYKDNDWTNMDPINQALSLANSMLYSVCHAAIVSLGFSPALGFIHTGKMLSFVYDIADLYKVDTTIPAAFEAVKQNNGDLRSTVRLCCRRNFEKAHLLKRIPQDIAYIFNIKPILNNEPEPDKKLWDKAQDISGGKNYSEGIV